MNNPRLLRIFAVLFTFLTLNLALTPSAFAIANLEFPAYALNEQAKADATEAANSTDTQIWFLAGCLGGIIGVLIAQAVEPKPSATALLGKSPEYIATYSDTYTEIAKKRQTRSAMNGCIAGTLVTVAFYAILIAAAASEDD